MDRIAPKPNASHTVLPLRGRHRLTLKDLAKTLGVSVTTVSRALRGDPGVSEEMRERIRQLAAESGYVHNPAGAALSTGRTRNIVFFVPYDIRQFPTLFHTEVLEGVAETVSDRGYDVILLLEKTLRRREQTVADALNSAHADGAVLLLMHSDALEPMSIDLRLPVVLVNHDLPELQLDCVVADDQYGGRIATEHLISSGHRRIAHISGPADVFTIRARHDGYRQALSDAGIIYDENLVASGHLSKEGGYAAAKALLDRPENPFTAMFVCMDLMALGAIEALRAHGLRVPDDVSVVGFDDDVFAEILSPALTTVRKPRLKMGMKAGELLLERMLGGGPRHRRRSLLKTSLITRDSVRPPRS